jgi:hypothetical protein
MNVMIDKAIKEIRGYLSDMNIPFLIASEAEDYIKRIAEAKYDKLAETSLFRKLKNRDEKEKLLIEFMFYLLNAFIKKNMRGDTPFKMFQKGILTDFFPEMGKRLINRGSPEGREVINLVFDAETSNYIPEKNSPESSLHPKPNKSDPGFFDGTSDILRKKLQKYINKQGGNNHV